MPSGAESIATDPVGVAHAPYGSLEDSPHEGLAGDAEAAIRVFDPYAAALAGSTRPTAHQW